jgi:type I restriction enzyme, S subunit
VSFLRRLPAGWSTATISDLITERGTFSDGDWIETEDQDPNGDVRLVQLADIGDGRFLDKSRRYLTQQKALELRCTFLEPGDVLVARMPDPLGRACIFPGDSKRAVTAVDVCIVRSGTEQIDRHWLTNVFNAPQFRVQVAALQSGSTRKRISRKNLATISFPVPPANEQVRIAEKIEELLSDLDASIAALQRAREKLKRYRAAVLKAAVEGKLTAEWRNSNPPSESAAKLLERILVQRRK